MTVHAQTPSAAPNTASAALNTPPLNAPATAAGTAQPLDLSRLGEPRNLEQVRLEELTIDGICGVY